LRMVTYIVLNYIRAPSIPVPKNGSLKDALEVIKTSWARLLLLLFSCQGSIQRFTSMNRCAAQCRRKFVNLIYSKLSVNIFFLLSFRPVPRSMVTVHCFLPATSAISKTAANYLIAYHQSIRKSSFMKFVLSSNERETGEVPGEAKIPIPSAISCLPQASKSYSLRWERM